MHLRAIATLSVRASILVAVWLPSAAQESGYESYHGYLGTYPDEVNTGFHENVQGVTHDADNWYFTNSGSLWRVPLGSDLAGEPVGGAAIVYIGDEPELAGYNHYGDLTWFDGRLFIPVTELDSQLPPVVAVYSAPTLAYIGQALLLDENSNPVDGAGWLAIDPDGRLYVAHGGGEVLYRYELDSGDLLNGAVTLQPSVGVIHLKEWDGVTSFTTPSPQGGVFSPTGDLLYMSSGFTSGGAPCWGAGSSQDILDKGGINVFDTTTWTRIAHSSSGGGTFNYEFNPGGPDCEEPQGLTIWNLASGQAPGSVHGQLHVLLLDNDISNDDEVSLKHYTNEVNVTPFVPSHPYKTVKQGVDFAWNGSKLLIVSASYPESVTIKKRVQLRAVGGPVIIGK